MTLHLLKMCVGIDSIDQLRTRQAQRLERLGDAGQPPLLRHWTRNFPRRAAEIEGDGSLYWIIKGHVRARQRITTFERLAGHGVDKRCAIVLDPELIETVPRRCRPMQGWRYLEAADAAADLPRSGDSATELPAEMLAELRHLGLA